ncbi:molybdopterin-dependent oxidoreductase [Acidimicrobiia bacterium EGI L10123]|uniref:molybdopterin cofactor-binding domain-containing protein n=1 Tax=Salinilacustrithrix flava TaxID=2957203 RepID=UPI003D7C2F81|nr:molybdopterin-dependent oxidoreductase [Acidimicrobiia bacterium EGI L10123]
MRQSPDVSRRRFLGYVVAGPTLITAARWIDPLATADAQELPRIGAQIAESYDLIDFLRDAARPTANLITVTVEDDGTVSFELHRTEVGQGINTAIAMIIAEEMDVPLSQVRITQADARPELLFNQLTGGSNSIYTIYDPVRIAAAVARQRLLDAAAIALGSAGAELGILDGVIRAPDGSSLGFGELARDASSQVTEAVDVQPKRERPRIVGTPQNRIDARAMVTGELRYTGDLVVPDALPTMVARPPTHLGRPVRLRNEAAVLAVPGVTHVALVESGVAVRARTFGQCIDALQVIDVEWAPGPAAGMSDESVQAALADAELPQVVPDTGALTPLGIPSPVQTRDFSFTFAFQPNCPLETNPCVADVRTDRAEIWGPMKNPVVAQQDIASALGLPQDAVTVHVVQGGGSFGRDLFWDAAREAALVSQAMGVPVKLSWTRTDDFRQGRAHPACRSSIRITRSETDIVSYAQHHTSVNTDFGHGLGEIITARADELPGGLGGMGFSQTVFMLTQYVPYDFGAVEQLLAETLPAPGEIETNVFRTGSMRNIYSPNVVTARELAIDQVAAEVGRDPLELRLSTLRDARSVAVLEKVAEAGSWGREMPAGTAQGLGFHSEYKGRAACLIEIDCRPETVSRTVPTAAYAYTGPRVTRAIYAVDVGLTINPRGLEAQMLGGMMDGIANCLSFSLHLVDGGFAEDSWEHAYYTRQWNVPFETQVFILDSSSQPGGAGEFGVAASMAATANAYARATGSMPTSFPINHGMPLAESIVPQGAIPQSPTDGLGRR